MLKTFLGDFKFYFFIKAFMSLFFLLSLKIYTSVLSPAEYGTFSILLFVINLSSVFLSSWLANSCIRFYPAYKEQKSVLYNTIVSALSITFLFALPILSLLFLILQKNLIKEIDFMVCVYSLLQIVLQTTFVVLTGTYSAERVLTKLSLYSFGQAISGFLIALVLLTICKLGISGIIIGNLCSYAFFSVLVFREQILRNFYFKIDIQLFDKIFKYGFPLLGLNLLAYFLVSSDQLILKYNNFHNELGAYAANYTLTDKSITVVASIFTSTYAPILFNLWETEGKTATYAFFKKAISIYIPLSITIVLFLYFSYNLIADMLFPATYKLNSIVIYILLGSFLYNISNIFSEILTLHKKTDWLASFYILPVLISILGNLFYVPKYGVQAAAAFTTISYFVLATTTVIFSIFLIKKN